MHRAIHQLFDQPLVFDDPLAPRIIGVEAERALRAKVGTPPPGPGARSWVVTRARYAEDRLSDALRRGVEQYVVIGAGLDTYAYRHGHPRLRVFEVDHPATQGWKRARLTEVGIAVPDRVAFVPIDFEHETLGVLAQAGLDFGAPAFLSWLGTTMYLRPETVLGALRDSSRRFAEGSEIVFDYIGPLDALPPERRAAFRQMAAEAAAYGEPYRSWFEPVALCKAAASLCFSRVEDVGGPALNARYLSGRRDGLTLQGPGHVLWARR
jgi:methyltransferase (TIGR00027 family)